MSAHDVSGEPRDERGRWVAGGGAAGGLDERTLDVGGDKWNQDTAARLEKEYESQRDALDKLAHAGADKEVEVSGPTMNWDDLSSGMQQSAEDKFIEDGLSSEVDHEVENWHENGGSLNDAAHVLAEDEDWKHDQLTDLIKDRDENEDTRIPYSVETLAKAITIVSPDYDGYKDDDKHPIVAFNNAALEHPDNHMSPDQLSFPGIETPQPHEALTEAMRKDITDWINEKFDETAKEKSSDMTPPDYLGDSAKESLGTMWSEMADDDKYEWAKKNGMIDEEGSGEIEAGTVRMPNKFDPLNETSGDNYRATQSVARYLSLERAEQLIKERGIKNLDSNVGMSIRQISSGQDKGKWIVVDAPEGKSGAVMSSPLDTKEEAQARLPNLPASEVDNADIANADINMWEGWKGSSVGDDGKMIQVAAHEELGGRLNTKHSDISKEASTEYANQAYKSVGGYEGVKAMLRAKWEATQYMLDKADMPMVSAYRGISMKTDDERIEEVKGDFIPGEPIAFKMLPDMPVARNGAASFSTDRSVSNHWKDDASRVVVRAEVPRTSVISVPAYGVNVHSEHEIVVMGTAWKAWDAWKKTAPSFGDIALKPHVAKAPAEKKTKAEKEHVVKDYMDELK